MVDNLVLVKAYFVMEELNYFQYFHLNVKKANIEDKKDVQKKMIGGLAIQLFRKSRGGEGYIIFKLD